MKKLTIIYASNGLNKKLSNSIREEAEKLKFDTNEISLVDLNLPLYSTEAEESGIPDTAKELADNLAKSDCHIFVAPEYNGSIPPTLNNAIAWISRSSKDWRSSFNGKPTLIATHSGGGGAHVLMSMRQQLSYVGANVIGRQLITNFSKPLNLDSLVACLKQL